MKIPYNKKKFQRILVDATDHSWMVHLDRTGWRFGRQFIDRTGDPVCYAYKPITSRDRYANKWGR